MIRVYLDKQIFSYLKKGDEPKYQKLLADLHQYKSSFLYCYSHAHMLDLKNDATDLKYDDLAFMETLVDDNYLSYHAMEKRTSCYLAKPLEAFEGIQKDDTPISFSNLFDLDLSFATEEQRKQITKAKDIFYNQQFDFGFSKIQKLPPELEKPLSKVLPIGVSKMSLMDWAEHFMTMLKSIEEDKTIYKGLRNVVDKYINNGKFTVDFNNIDFNDDLKNSVLKKSFIEYINGNLNPNGNKKVTDYEFFNQAYFTLDLLGISKEKSKKVKFRNVLNDGFHSYYGAFCDYVVSNDEGFLKKSKALYKLLNIQTQVLHIDEFAQSINLLGSNDQHDSQTFFRLLTNDLSSGLVLGSKPSLSSDRVTTKIKPYHNYLGYFNKLVVIKENNQDYLLLSRQTQNYSYFYFYREIEGIVNKAVKLFGADFNFKENYNWTVENNEINEDEWTGRYWKFGTFDLVLEINKGTHDLTLMITPNK